MNLSAVRHTCVCLAGLHIRRTAVASPSPRMLILQKAHCRNMSLWYMAKTRIKRAWSEQVKIESSTKIQKFGVEIGTADMLARLGARIQFTNGEWYTKANIRRGSLPVEELQGHFVVAIDAKDTHLDPFSMADVVKLSQLKYLSLEGCPLIDDHCLASLVNVRDTLTHLNVNGCPDVTENGIGTLHKLRNLERLNMNDMPKVNHAALVAVMLEDVMPRLRISLVSKQVERYMENARKGMEIIKEHRRSSGLLEDKGVAEDSMHGQDRRRKSEGQAVEQGKEGNENGSGGRCEERNMASAASSEKR